MSDGRPSYKSLPTHRGRREQEIEAAREIQRAIDAVPIPDGLVVEADLTLDGRSLTSFWIAAAKRLGRILYWFGCGVALVVATLIMWTVATSGNPDALEALAVVCTVGLGLVIACRTCVYVFTGR